MALSTEDFELLLQANRILSSKLEVEEVLQAVMELATKVVRAEASSLLLLDENANELYFDVALGSVKETVKRIRLKVGEGIAGWVAKDRRPLIVNDVSQDPRFTEKVDKSTSFKTNSILAVPLLAKGKLIGVVEAINKEHKGSFSSHDQEAFEIFASQAAIAIENARLFSEIIREKEKLNTVFGEMSDGLFLLDREGKVLLMNPAGSTFVGLKPNEVVGKKFDLGLFKGFKSNPLLDTISQFKSKVTEVELVRTEGKDFYVSALILQMQSSDTTSNEGYLAILRDSTEEKRGEQLKRNFLSLISHKLKTPLTVIIGYGPVLQSQMEDMSEIQKKAITAICDQGEHLSELVDKLLRYTMVEAESLKPNQEEKSLKPLIEESLKSLTEELEPESFEAKVDPSLDKMPNVFVDATLTMDLFKNLIENALKFNDKKKKTIQISSERVDGKVIVHLKDNGVGIPAEERGKIFQKFYQIENSFTGQVPGAGLGLALCKKVVESMGGEINLSSDIGKGTTVSVSLPCKSKPRPL